MLAKARIIKPKTKTLFIKEIYLMGSHTLFSTLDGSLYFTGYDPTTEKTTKHPKLIIKNFCDLLIFSEKVYLFTEYQTYFYYSSNKFAESFFLKSIKDKITNLFVSKEHTFNLTLYKEKMPRNTLKIISIQEEGGFFYCTFLKKDNILYCDITNLKTGTIVDYTLKKKWEMVFPISIDNKKHKAFFVAKDAKTVCVFGLHYEKQKIVKHHMLFKTNIEGVIQISVGKHHLLILTKNHIVYSWGNNHYGQCGIGENLNYLRFLVQVKLGNEKISGISAGIAHSFFVSKSGEVFACGANYDCIFGIKEKKKFYSPVKLKLGVKIEKIRSNVCNTFFIGKYGDIFSAGFNKYGQCGVYSKSPCTTIKLVPNLFWRSERKNPMKIEIEKQKPFSDVLIKCCH